MAKRKTSPYARQARYAVAARAEGRHVKLTVDLRTEGDVATFRALQRRFAELSNAAIVRLALRELAVKANKR